MEWFVFLKCVSSSWLCCFSGNPGVRFFFGVRGLRRHFFAGVNPGVSPETRGSTRAVRRVRENSERAFRDSFKRSRDFRGGGGTKMQILTACGKRRFVFRNERVWAAHSALCACTDVAMCRTSRSVIRARLIGWSAHALLRLPRSPREGLERARRAYRRAESARACADDGDDDGARARHTHRVV